MANEIQINLSLNASKNGAQVAGSTLLSIDMSGDQFISNVQIIGTSNEALVVGDVTTVGFVSVKNLDTTNYLEVFLDNANAQLVAKLLPGEACLFKPGTVTLYARANTAACNAQVILIEL
jgi:hypothetical protein